jgi:ribonuclease E
MTPQADAPDVAVAQPEAIAVTSSPALDVPAAPMAPAREFSPAASADAVVSTPALPAIAQATTPPAHVEFASATTALGEPVIAKAVADESVEPVHVGNMANASSTAHAVASPEPRVDTPATPAKAEDFKPMLDAAGLVWVNTDRSKWQQAATAAAEVVQPARTPRRRKPSVAAPSAPMVQIETQKAPEA